MNQTKNGEVKLSYVDDKLQEVITKIEKQANLFAINKVNIDVSCTGYLKMSEDELSKMTPEELSIAEIKLSVYAMTIQKYINTSNAIKNWAERCLGLVVAQEYGNYDKWMKYEIRRDSVVGENEYAKKLYEIIGEQSLIIDEMAYLAQSVNHTSDAFGRFARIRRKE